ncbi:Uncharacterised protein [Raoultella planticola]|uniref:Uncharacterized protein n=1 Tax=Raoultella planticola TaxID=575 RepID=A0A485ATM1_RAOPL|nr:Uncharacterised protein [Raoultella planticola]
MRRLKNVVSPPQNPVVISSFHIGSMFVRRLNHASPAPNDECAQQVCRECADGNSVMHWIELHSKPPAQYAAGTATNKNG